MTRIAIPDGGNIAGPFIRRPIATTLLAIGVLLAGVIARSFPSFGPGFGALAIATVPAAAVSMNLRRSIFGILLRPYYLGPSPRSKRSVL